MHFTSHHSFDGMVVQVNKQGIVLFHDKTQIGKPFYAWCLYQILVGNLVKYGRTRGFNVFFCTVDSRS